MCGKLRSSNGEMKMHAAESVIVRVSIVLGMVAAVVTILYFSPIPDHYFKSCDRPCHELDYPMICRIKITLELDQIAGSSCNDCLQTNATSPCDYERCVQLQSRSTLNRPQLPSIQVCENDVLVVDVENKIGGRSLAIHWRGQSQRESPFMDGVPMITQCPIPSYTTFQYKFRASAAGTHLWQAHSHADTDNGVYGALIVRQSDQIDPYKRLYDVDAKNHHLLIAERSFKAASTVQASKTVDGGETARLLYINGKSVHGGALETFTVTRGKRYRFRAVYASSTRNCPVTVTIERHAIKVIAIDGHPTVPYDVTSVTFGKGERVDFVLTAASKTRGNFHLKARSTCDEDSVVSDGLAVIEYVDDEDYTAPSGKLSSKAGEDAEEKEDVGVTRRLNTGQRAGGSSDDYCIDDLRSLKKLPNDLRRRDVDRTIYLAYDYEYYYTKTDESDKPVQRRLFKMNNVTFTYPPSPLLTQKQDVPKQMICNDQQISRDCNNRTVCECVHVIDVPLRATVELVLHDLGGDSSENIFHLHGYSFYVVGTRRSRESIDFDTLISLNEYEDSLFKRNLINPVIKDTIRVPRFSTVALRFIANNPGYWMLRDEKSLQWTRGMDVILKVGQERNFNMPPSSFPTCGSWRGPDFFFT